MATQPRKGRDQECSAAEFEAAFLKGVREQLLRYLLGDDVDGHGGTGGDERRGHYADEALPDDSGRKTATRDDAAST